MNIVSSLILDHLLGVLSFHLEVHLNGDTFLEKKCDSDVSKVKVLKSKWETIAKYFELF